MGLGWGECKDFFAQYLQRQQDILTNLRQSRGLLSSKF